METLNASDSRTRWTVVLAANGDGPEAVAALQSICSRFDPLLLSDAKALNNFPLEPADIVQEFWVIFLDSKLWTRANPEFGRLRTFMFTCFRNFRKRCLERAHAKKRMVNVTFSIEDLLEDVLEEEEDFARRHRFDYCWAAEIYCEAVASVKREWQEADDLLLFDTLKHHLMRDIPDATSTRLGASLGMTPVAVRKAASRLAAEIKKAVRKGAAQYLSNPTPSEIDEEVEYLFKILSGAPPSS